MKNKDLKCNYDSKLKTPLILGFEFCFCFFSFSLLASRFISPFAAAGIPSEQFDPTDFLATPPAEISQDVNVPNMPTQSDELISARQERTQTTDVAPTSSTAKVPKKLAQRGFTVAENPNTYLEHQLWRARVTIPEGEKDKKRENELKDIIERIRSIEFKPQKDAPEPFIVVEPAIVTEPNKTPANVKTTEKSKEIKSKLPYEPVTDQTLQTLKRLSEHPDQLDNPFELAEVLFLSGHLKEAAMLYQEALTRKSNDEAGSAEDRAWILFQIGNCLRDDDLSAARKMYRQLITEYPDSPWTELAKARDKLIDWYLQDEPRKLISECRP
jgi:TolA-binding protein